MTNKQPDDGVSEAMMEAGVAALRRRVTLRYAHMDAPTVEQIYLAMQAARTPPEAEPSEAVVERVAAAIDDALPESDDFTLAPSQIKRAARAAIAALRTAPPVDALALIADALVDQRDEPWPSGSVEDRLHYWRNKAIDAAEHIRAALANSPTDEGNK